MPHLTHYFINSLQFVYWFSNSFQSRLIFTSNPFHSRYEFVLHQNRFKFVSHRLEICLEIRFNFQCQLIACVLQNRCFFKNFVKLSWVSSVWLYLRRLVIDVFRWVFFTTNGMNSRISYVTFLMIASKISILFLHHVHIVRLVLSS